MKIVSYNVNGIRAAMSKGLLDWLKAEKPDVVCLQETKAQPDQMPTFELQSLGYNCYFYSAQKKGYSGVAILSLQKPDHVEFGMGIPKYDDEGRLIRADFGDLSVISVYHPSGTSGEERQAFKMVWLKDFQDYIKTLEKTRKKLIISGDYNICHEAIDIHDPVRNAKNSGFLPEEREWMSGFLNAGYIDSFRHLNKEPGHYSWWSYRAKGARERNLGWRLDYHMLTRNLDRSLKNSAILPDVKHSDHCPVVIEINV